MKAIIGLFVLLTPFLSFASTCNSVNSYTIDNHHIHYDIMRKADSRHLLMDIYGYGTSKAIILVSYESKKNGNGKDFFIINDRPINSKHSALSKDGYVIDSYLIQDSETVNYYTGKLLKNQQILIQGEFMICSDSV